MQGVAESVASPQPVKMHADPKHRRVQSEMTIDFDNTSMVSEAMSPPPVPVKSPKKDRAREGLS